MAKYEYSTGSSIFVTASFTDPLNEDAPIDPTTVALAVKGPGEDDFTAVASGITNTAVGEYEYTLALPLEGTYRWKWTGTTGTRVVVIPGSCDSVDRA